MKKVIGLLVMAYGTPYKEEDIEPYYTHIRRGRKPSEEMLEDLKGRYEAIGGISPLASITLEQGKSLEQYLNQIQDEVTFKLYLGLKHITPFIEEAVADMEKDGIKEAVSIVLAPHYSTFSVKSYNGRAKEEAEKRGITLFSIEEWYKQPQFIAYWTHKLKGIMAEMTEEEIEKMVVIFSAHSLPEKILTVGDPYTKQLEETAQLISKESGIPHYEIGWQSAGNTGEPWIGPDVQDLTRDLYKEKGYKTFVYCPVGFVSDHLEVLYDNDVECKIVTDELNANYVRPPMPNIHPLFIAAMGDVLVEKVKENVLMPTVR